MFDTINLSVEWDFRTAIWESDSETFIKAIRLNGQRIDSELSPWLVEAIHREVLDRYEADLNALQSSLDGL